MALTLEDEIKLTEFKMLPASADTVLYNNQLDSIETAYNTIKRYN